jgi:L-threonine kinase
LNTEARELVAVASARTPGTCGELVQGMIDGKHFLVTCPVDMYATATVDLWVGSGHISGPQDSPKARHAVELALAHLGETGMDAHLRLSSPLPRGKGMASSTADVVSAIQATATALSAKISTREIADLALRVEPSDGVMFPGIALFDHRQGSIAETLGPPPPMRVVVLDFGGTVDTLAFNGVDRRDILKRSGSRLQEALVLITEGVRSGDVGLIGQGATMSALAHQEILFKPQLDAVIKLASDVGAAGVNVAHSGTVIGLIFEDEDSIVENAVSQVWGRLFGLERVFHRRVVGGGVFSA